MGDVAVAASLFFFIGNFFGIPFKEKNREKGPYIQRKKYGPKNRNIESINIYCFALMSSM